MIDMEQLSRLQSTSQMGDDTGSLLLPTEFSGSDIKACFSSKAAPTPENDDEDDDILPGGFGRKSSESSESDNEVRDSLQKPTKNQR